ncbi:hypothetical protein BPOR_0195g00020 [Botrytis porri]|uniref:2EXR domain-containing protein n=1 Tax=Botrytis porri TaxID=87229 RepID=A0A4Z1KTT6_9HELO|nr:hypothetical protein BPOR_0195g00020 [Botrytis porri]
MSLSSRTEIRPALFAQFNDLPTDIRLFVWEYCIPLPRVVVLTHSPVKSPVNSVDEVWAFRSQTPVPDILFVDRESYHIATRFYERAFINRYREDTHTLAETWFDFKWDILYLPQQHITAQLSDFLSALPRSIHGNQDTGGFNKVKNLALPIRCIETFELSKARDAPLLAPEPFPPYSVARHMVESESFVVDEEVLDVEREKWNDDVASRSKSFATNITDERDGPDKRQWEMPSFETKILVSRDYQEGFEAQRLDYLNMIEGNVERHKIQGQR